MGYSLDFSIVWDNFGLFVAGAWLTIQISLFLIAFGLIAGIIGALFRISGNRLLDWIAIAYSTDIWRGSIEATPKGQWEAPTDLIQINEIKLSHNLKNVEALRREVGMVFHQLISASDGAEKCHLSPNARSGLEQSQG